MKWMYHAHRRVGARMRSRLAKSHAYVPIAVFTLPQFDLYTHPPLHIDSDQGEFLCDTGCVRGSAPCIVLMSQTAYTKLPGEPAQVYVQIPVDQLPQPVQPIVILEDAETER